MYRVIDITFTCCSNFYTSLKLSLYGYMKTLIVDTFNGEGYSEPDIQVSNLRNSTETLEIVDQMRLSYGDEYIESQTEGDNKGDVILNIDNGEDQGSIHIMDIPTPEFYIVQIRPQINEVKFWVKMPTMEKALETLEEHIVNDTSFGWDEDELEEYETGQDFFSAHGQEEFYYFKIVQG